MNNKRKKARKEGSKRGRKERKKERKKKRKKINIIWTVFSSAILNRTPDHENDIFFGYDVFSTIQFWAC
jgi:hypothetical protein